MASLKTTLGAFLLLAAVANTTPVASPKAAPAAPASNSFQFDLLRIEGKSDTIYEGPIISSPGYVTTATGGTHLCNGKNGAANSNPGSTPTDALSAASLFARFSFDGTYNMQVANDFYITSIGTSTATATKAWGLLVNYQPVTTGGCEYETKTGDSVLWAFDAASKVYFLDLEGPTVVVVGQTYHLTVTDGASGVAVMNAKVGTATSNAQGVVTLTAPSSPGFTSFKATRSDSLRSNSHEVIFI